MKWKTGFSRQITKINLADYIQMLCLGGATKTIQVDSRTGSGQICIDRGKIINATVLIHPGINMSGEPAFHSILSLEKGKIKHFPKLFDQNVTIEKDYMALLIESVKQKDEQKAIENANTQGWSDKQPIVRSIRPTESTKTDLLPNTPNHTPKGRPRLKKLFMGGGLCALLLLISMYIIPQLQGHFVIGSSTFNPESDVTALADLDKVDRKTDIHDANKSPARFPIHRTKEIILRLHGSNTVGAKLAPMVAQAFLKTKMNALSVTSIERPDNACREIIGKVLAKEIAIEIEAKGSSTGFVDLKSDACDIAMASRRVKEKEAEILTNLGDMTSLSNEHVIALDGIAVIVHPANLIDNLDVKTIAKVFTGKISNWSEVGGPNGPIAIYARDGNSGTYDTFKNLCLGKLPLAPNAMRFDSNQELSDAVSKDLNGIGFCGLPYVDKSKAVGIAEIGADTVHPTFFTVATEDYALSRRLYMYTASNPQNPYVLDFIKFCLSSAGQQLASQAGFVDMNIKSFQFKPNSRQSKDHAVAEKYLRLAENALRLSMNFRFNKNDASLDNRSQHDLERMVGFFKRNSKLKIILVGFADNTGDYYYNQHLAYQRATIVQEALESRGIPVSEIISAGEEFSIATNSTEKGRQKNRRVEIWVSRIQPLQDSDASVSPPQNPS